MLCPAARSVSEWLRKSLQEALASKVSLKLSPEHRSSTLSGR